MIMNLVLPKLFEIILVHVLDKCVSLAEGLVARGHHSSIIIVAHDIILIN